MPVFKIMRPATCLVLLFTGFRSVAQIPSWALEPDQFEYITSVDERYQSVNIEMCEVVGGDFWVPYELIDYDKVKRLGFPALKHKIPEIDLYNTKLRNLAKGLGPMYIRVSGTWANAIYFQNNDSAKLEKAPEGYDNILTRAQWKGVLDFCAATQSKLVTSFSISSGIRDENGNWTPAQIDPLVQYTKSQGGEISAAAMFNEPSHASYGNLPSDYNGEAYAIDFNAFKTYTAEQLPDMKILGPGSAGEGGLLGTPDISTDSIMRSHPTPKFDVFAYHYYGAASKRCGGLATPESALTKEWLSKTEQGLAYYENARNLYAPNTPIWLTETAEAACGGNPWASTFVDSFRYIEQLGRLAKKDVQVVMHNTLTRSEYGLLENDTHDPKPNYWAALLWAKLVGTKVYESHSKSQNVDVFIHSAKNPDKKFVAILVNPTALEEQMDVPFSTTQYTLTTGENKLESKEIQLNGKVLQLNPDHTLPEITGRNVAQKRIHIPAYSIMFIEI